MLKTLCPVLLSIAWAWAKWVTWTINKWGIKPGIKSSLVWATEDLLTPAINTKIYYLQFLIKLLKMSKTITKEIVDEAKWKKMMYLMNMIMSD